MLWTLRCSKIRNRFWWKWENTFKSFNKVAGKISQARPGNTSQVPSQVPQPSGNIRKTRPGNISQVPIPQERRSHAGPPEPAPDGDICILKLPLPNIYLHFAFQSCSCRRYICILYFKAPVAKDIFVFCILQLLPDINPFALN